MLVPPGKDDLQQRRVPFAVAMGKLRGRRSEFLVAWFNPSFWPRLGSLRRAGQYIEEAQDLWR
jgi:hypothetical protein